MSIAGRAISSIGRVNRLYRVQRAMNALSTFGQKVVYLDIGSAGGVSRHYRRASRKGLVLLLLLDTQDDWRRSSGAGEYKGCAVRHIKTTLGARQETRPFYVTAAPGCSSCLYPNQSVLGSFPVKEWFRVVSQSEVSVQPYEAVHSQLNVPVPDIVKLDVQGMELEVLAGFGGLLDGVTCVEMEVNFEQLYVNQPVMHEVYGFMHARGFVLRDLKPQGPFEGVAMEYNSYWTRRDLTGAKQRIVTFWESIHDVWPGQYFVDVDVMARRHVRFN